MKKTISFIRKRFRKQSHRINNKETLERDIDLNKRILQEILNAIKFNNTIEGSKWFVNKNISPGGSAVDYAFFYTLYRTLCSFKPHNILEFGLGQSSKMVHQYANFFNEKAVTVEHDNNWANFFTESIDGNYPVKIKIMELDTIDYKGVKALTYKDCENAFGNQKFDLIIVDGPFGYAPDTVYSRPQIIEIAKNNVEENFVIIIDDFDRTGEKNTTKELFDFFDQENIQYVYQEYGSLKKHLLITTPKQKFLTSL
jgi:hypothetical protein